ncbi:carboxypeptidase regulatory-like domain-containing protein [Streptomyces sp. MS1.HAVA.3]|uniref:Carboxypeptidase regulatory-like domain-containing protein n=1 Tax=Streptomyces caledonius TaxID=3134107 RepID=A0ABU8TY06_9ACTN
MGRQPATRPRTPTDAGAARHRLIRALAELLHCLAVDALVVEDVHWADETTLEFLLFLVSRQTLSFNLVLTYRPEDVAADSLILRLSSRMPAGVGIGCVRVRLGCLSQGVDSERGTTGASRLSGFDQCSGDDVSWLSVNRTTLTLAPGRSARLHVAADARGFAAPGTHAAALALLVDAPYHYAPLPVTLKATVPASWAEMAGTVNDAATGKPLVGATVTVSRAGTSPYTVTTDGQGRYHVWRNASTVTVTAAHPGHAAQSQKVTLKRGTLTTVPFALSRR